MNNRLLHLVSGPLLLLLTLVLTPSSLFELPSRIALGTMLWMGYWWVTLPVNPAITALLPIVINALTGLVPMKNITSLYFSDIVVLLLGANMVSATWTLTGLDKRLALKSLCILGNSLTQHIIGWFLIAVALSSVLPNAVVCALLVPLAMSMINYLNACKSHLPKNAVFTLLLAICWGCGLGGLGTPLGGAMNLVAVSYLESLSGTEFYYWDWVETMLPFVFLLTLSTLAFLLLIRPRAVPFAGGKEYFSLQYAKMKALSFDEILALSLFCAPLILSFLRDFYVQWFPGLKPAYLFLIAGILTFVIPKKGGAAFATWKDIGPKIEWQILLLFAGGLALGELLIRTGTTNTVASIISGMHLTGTFWVLIVICAITMFFVEVASNTAAAAIAVPMVICLAQEIGLSPTGCVFATAVAFNTGFMFPTSIRAIPVAYGLEPGFMLKYGFANTILTIISIASASSLILF